MRYPRARLEVDRLGRAEPVSPTVGRAADTPKAVDVDIVVALPSQFSGIEFLNVRFEVAPPRLEHHHFSVTAAAEVPGDREAGGAAADHAEVGLDAVVARLLGEVDDHPQPRPAADRLS